MKVNVYITLKHGVLDPQGKATQTALHHLGFDGVTSVRQGKFIELEIDDSKSTDINDEIKRMCEQILANTVIERFEYEIVDQ